MPGISLEKSSEYVYLFIFFLSPLALWSGSLLAADFFLSLMERRGEKWGAEGRRRVLLDLEEGHRCSSDRVAPTLKLAVSVFPR